MVNSSLREEPRNQQAGVIPARNEASLLDWLESSGRLISRTTQETEDFLAEEEEISGLIDVDDVTYDLDDDSEELDLEE